MLTGCRKVRVEIRGELGSIIYCHCESCRKAQGTAFVTNAPVAEEAFVVAYVAVGAAAILSRSVTDTTPFLRLPLLM
jgi:hypothetical protein